ncbi:MAG: AbrB/MazE/SpoVT family DNA-binding domain-containing protein [Clostridia bacterium]|nr:AbrB/MazE/SpoVT family DNA-binding domain-containing protein [Clostridia bacterium]
MKATGIVRKFDENGRFVLPMEIRRQLNLNEPDAALEVFLEGDAIVLKKYAPACIFCGSLEEIVSFRDKKICKKCADKIHILFEE